MRYLPVCAPDFSERWFPHGVTDAALAQAPMLAFDRKDDLQDRRLHGRKFTGAPPPRHYVPAAQEFGDAIRRGMGWGLMPDLEIGEDLRTGVLEILAPGAPVDVVLYWQQWRRGSAVLAGVADAVQAAARVLR
jgi:LysR family transcriptional regulator, chromosome initiation inhibitor